MHVIRGSLVVSKYALQKCVIFVGFQVMILYSVGSSLYIQAFPAFYRLLYYVQILVSLTYTPPILTNTLLLSNHPQVILGDSSSISNNIVVLGAKVDAICARRSTGCETASHTEQKAELLAQMNGAKEDNIGVLFVSATNLPWNLDPAFLCRFEIKLYIPNHKARERML